MHGRQSDDTIVTMTASRDDEHPNRATAVTTAYYDQLAEVEDDRLRKDIPGRVSFEIHRRFLVPFLRPGDRVLEIGAGPGRFTTVLAEMGASVVVTDISRVQLDLNRERITGSPAENAVERHEILDVRDTNRYNDGEFDLVLAFGGPLSYAFEAERDAAAGLLRITKPEGFVVASVMSLLGTWRHHLAGVVGVAATVGEEVNDRVLTTGDMRHLGAAANHQCRMFRSQDVRRLVAESGGKLVGMSASNWASLGPDETLRHLESDPDRWARFLSHEQRACAEPGALDGGTHILFTMTHNPGRNRGDM